MAGLTCFRRRAHAVASCAHAAGARGCFLHFGELFTTIDAINSVVFYELAAHPSLIDLVLDTNFINFSIKNKIDVVKGMTDCLLAKCIPVVLDSVMAELEKLGSKYRVALRLAKDPRFMRMASYLKKGTYADDDIVEHARVHRCFIVATCDKDLKRRLRKIPGVPIMYIQARKYTIERMPEAYGLMPKT